MVYNALKLFMEINPNKFEEAQDNYRNQRRLWVIPLSENALLTSSKGE